MKTLMSWRALVCMVVCGAVLVLPGQAYAQEAVLTGAMRAPNTTAKLDT